MFSQRKTEVSYGNTSPRNFVVWYVEEKFLKSNLGFWSSGASGALEPLKPLEFLEPLEPL